MRVVIALVAVVGFFVLFVGGGNALLQADRTEQFKREFAKCKIQMLDLNIRNVNLPERMALCLNAKGFDNKEIEVRVKQLPL